MLLILLIKITLNEYILLFQKINFYNINKI